MAYNKKYGIVPKGVSRPIGKSCGKEREEDLLAVSENVSKKEVKKLLKQLEKEMMEAVKKLEFEKRLY